MKLRRHLLIAAALGAVAGPAEAAPDFSGIWAHPWLPGFEPLPSGPTSLVNLSRSADGKSSATPELTASHESGKAEEDSKHAERVITLVFEHCQ